MRRPHKIPMMYVAGLCVTIGVIVIARFSQFSVAQMSGAMPYFCPMKTFFHVPCPGCGMTHSIFALLKGDLQLALFYNPLVFLLLGIILIAVTRLYRVIPEKVQRVSLMVVIFSIVTWWVWERFLPTIGI